MSKVSELSLWTISLWVSAIAMPVAASEPIIDESPLDANAATVADSLSGSDEGETAAVITNAQVVPGTNAKPVAAVPLPNLDAATTADSLLAQDETTLAVITDVQIETTPEGLTVTLISDQPLSAGTPQVVDNALVTNIANATLALTDESAAEQFSPAEGIALVQVTTLPDGDVQLAITGTDAPPAAQINAQANNLVFSVLPGIASAVTSDPEAIRVVVTATRTEEEITDVPRTVRVIEREEIEQQLEFTTNLNTVLGQLLPGFSPPPLRDGARGFTLRGRGVQVLVDGIPQNPNAFSNGELDTFSLDSLERIEVVPGASALYGDGAAGGTINLITRAPLEEAGVLYNVNVGASLPLTNLSTDAGFSYSGGIDIAGSDGRSDGRISLNYDEVNASFDADGNRIIPVSGLNEFDRLALLVKVGHDFDENQRIGLTYGFYRDTPDTEFGSDTSIFEIPGTQIARPIFIGDFDYERSPGRITNVVNLTYRNTDIFGSQLDAQVYFNNFEDVATFGDIRDRTDLPDLFPDLFQNFFELTEIGTRVQVDTPLGDTANLLWGIDYSQEDNQGSAAVLDIPAFDANRELNIVEEFTTIDYELENLGLFAQARWDITDQFQISGGLRYDDISFDANDFIAVFVREDELPRERQGGSGGFDDVSFNAGLLYRPIPEVGLFANFSQGFSVPNVLRGLDNGPTFNPDNIQLEPITVDNYEIGVRAEFDTIQASIAGFYSESDLGASLRFDSDTGLTTLDRAPQRNYGVEVAVDWQPSDFWRLGGNFTWSEGENDRNDDGDFEPLTSLSVPPIKVGLYVENRTTPRWSNRLQLLFVGDRDRAFDEGVDRFEVESYFSLDLLSTLKIGSSGRLTLGLENLLNSDDLVLNSQERVSVFEDRRFARPGITASLRYSVEF